jgi:prepilin-type N-terminal cleavage/methylation domain-containing protein
MRCSRNITPPTRRFASGFTLIELIAVMTIVAIMGAIAVPSLSSISQMRERSSARQLLRDLTFARQRSMATGARTWVVFDLSAQTWSLQVEDPLQPGRANAQPLDDPTGSTAYVVSLGAEQSAGVQLASADFDGDPEVGFNRLGEPLNRAELPLGTPGLVAFSGGSAITVSPGCGVVTPTY